MGSDLYMLSQEIAIRTQPRMRDLLAKIRERLKTDPIGGWEDLIAEIDRELDNAKI